MAGLLFHPDTRIVVPLLPQQAPPPISKPNPVLGIRGPKRHVMATQALNAVSSRELKRAVMQSSAARQHHQGT